MEPKSIVSTSYFCAVLLTAALLFPSLAFAQNGEVEKEKSSFADRLFFGGNINVNFGTVTVLGATPVVGYRISDKLSAGVGGTYVYFAENIPGYGDFSTSLYGGNIFARYRITNEIFLQSEYHQINTEVWQFGEFRRLWVPMAYVGGGYRVPIGRNSGLLMMILYDLIGDPNAPFSNPMVTGGFVFGN